MPLQTSGQITLNEIHVEAGGTSGTQASINDSDIRDMIGKASGATASFNEYYGASSSIFDSTQNNSVWGASYHSANATYGSASGSGWSMYASDLQGYFGSAKRSHLSGVTVVGDGRTVEVEYDITMGTVSSSVGLGYSTYARTGFSNTMSTSSSNALSWQETLAYYIPLGNTGSGLWKLDGTPSSAFVYNSTYGARFQGTCRINLPSYSNNNVYVGMYATAANDSHTVTVHSLIMKEI